MNKIEEPNFDDSMQLSIWRCSLIGALSMNVDEETWKKCLRCAANVADMMTPKSNAKMSPKPIVVFRDGEQVRVPTVPEVLEEKYKAEQTGPYFLKSED